MNRYTFRFIKRWGTVPDHSWPQSTSIIVLALGDNPIDAEETAQATLTQPRIDESWHWDCRIEKVEARGAWQW